ncbi:MAG: transposase domain-containing protein [Candidatus Binatus sp.]
MRLEALAELAGPELRRACKEIAARHGVGFFTVRRAVIRVQGRPSELWAFLLLDGNRGRSRHEYGRDWDRHFRSFYLVRTAPAASICLDNACKSITKMDVGAARRAGIRVPTSRALLDRLHSELSQEAILLARCGADAVAARHYQDRDYSSLAAGEALNGDGHRLDWFVKRPDGYVGRPVLFALQCLFSNSITGWRIDWTENRDLVRLCAADAFRKALPKSLYLDNGRAGASKWLTGGVSLGRRFRFKTKSEDAIGVFRLLGIDLRFTNPYAGRSKKIERFWGDFESHLRGRPELRLAYAGNGKDEPAERAAAHAVPIELFIRILGEEIAAYNGRGHDELWNRSVASGAVLRKATESQLRLLLLAAQKVRIHAKDSCIHIFGNRYEVSDITAGTDVIVRFDPARLFDDLFLYDREGRYLGAAKCVAPVGFADHAAARETARLNSVRKRALRAELDAQDLIGSIELAGSLPQVEPPAPAAAKVVRPFRSPIEAPRVTEREVFSSALDIYDDDQKQVG